MAIDAKQSVSGSIYNGEMVWLHMSNNLVSIIIPSFNSQEWVCDAIDSSLQQTYAHCEVIVVDDGSTDNTRELLQQKYGNRIKYIYQENRGLAGARNTGVRNASGDYLQFLDADDEITPDKIEKQVKILEQHKEYTVAFSDFEYFEGGASNITKLSPETFRKKYQTGNLWKPFLTGNFIVVHAALARKADVVAVGCFDESIWACEDYDLWMRLAGRGCNFVYTNGIMARYRLTPGSMSSARIMQIRGTIYVLLKNISEFGLNDEGDKSSARNYIASLHTALGELYCSEGHPIKSIVHCFRAVHFAPWQWPNISKVLLNNLHFRAMLSKIIRNKRFGVDH